MTLVPHPTLAFVAGGAVTAKEQIQAKCKKQAYGAESSKAEPHKNLHQNSFGGG